jgi:HEAT repeats
MSAPQPFQCKEATALLVFYACGETSEKENGLIGTHLAACATCAAQLAEERGLHDSLMEALQASEQVDTGGILLSQCRSELAEVLDDLSAPPFEERWQPFGWLRRWMAFRPVLSGALLVLFGAGLGMQVLPWISARLDSTSSGQTVNVSPSTRFTDDQLAKMAVAGINLAPTSEGAPGTLQVHVRTEEPLVLSGSVDDPDLRRVLTYVVENGDQTDAGVRLDCLEALRARNADLDVRRALLFAARKDQNPAVRMKALESLRDVANDKAVRETLIDTLEHDANPGVRVEAVNLLVRSLEPGALDPENAAPALAPEGADRPLDPSMERVVRTLEDLQRNDPNRYVRLRSAAALRQIGPRELH